MVSAFDGLQACETAMSNLARLWRPKDGRARSSIVRKTGLDRRPPSRMPQDGAIWTCAVFIWYFAMFGFQPQNIMLGVQSDGEHPQDRESPPRQQCNPRWSGLNLFLWMAAVKEGKKRTVAV